MQVNLRIGKGTRYNLPTHNFTTHWSDGRRLCALVDSYEPGTVPHFDEDEEPLAVAEWGIDAAMELLEVPPVLTPDDMTHPNLDELSMITYLSVFRENAEAKLAADAAMAPSPPPPPRL